MWNLKKKQLGTKEHIFKTQLRVTDMENNFMVSRGGEERIGRLGLTHKHCYI